MDFQIEFNRLTSPLNNFALKLTRNSEDAKDLYQETAFKALTNQDKFTPGTNLKAWLFTIMRNLFINNKRKKSSRVQFVDTSDNQYFLNSTRTTSNGGDSSIMMDELNNILSSLSENIRYPFLMHHEGFKYHEIAEILGLPIGTIKSRIFFARKTLVKKVRARYGEDFRLARR